MDYQELYQRLFYVSKQAGVVARMMQEGILNDGKKVAQLAGEDAYHKAMREAKTRTDEIVQEMMLTALLPTYQHVLSLDVEEETKSMQSFPKQDYTYTFVLDPIDGTLDYLYQKDTYSICSMILHEHDVKIAIVYFPARDELYSYCEGIGTKIYRNLQNCECEDGEILNVQPKKDAPIRIYKNNRLPQDIVELLQCKGFEVVDDQYEHIGCPDALLSCLRGEALAYFSHTRNIRDIVVGAILGKMEAGNFYTFDGCDAVWERQGRQKEMVFSIYSREKIFK